MENGNTDESQKSELKFKRFSKRNIYMKKKIAEDKNKQNEEPKENPKEELREESKDVQKEEEKIIQVNKITTKKDNNPDNHKTNPKFKVKNDNIEENNDINQNEVNNNENKITVNLKKDNDIKNDKDNDSNIKSNENINEKSNENKNNDKDNINQDIKDINTGKKINSNSDLKISNINLISPEANIDTNSNSNSKEKEKEKESETKNNKARNKLDIIKDPSKSLLSGGPKKECPQCHALIESHLYKIHVKNVHLSQILSWLYLGSFANACDLDELKRNNIKYILNCAVECKNENLPSDIKELHLKLVDEPEFDITKHFKQTNDFINKVRTAGGNLLVHCKVGLSRSPTVIIAYLIKYYEFTADSAINFIKRKRPQIIPNQGFIKQLYEYEKQFEKKFKKKAKK